MIFCITTFLHMERRARTGDTAPGYAVPRTLTGSGGVRMMKYRLNSGPDIPCPPLPAQRVPPGRLLPACLERERARIYRMMTCWDGPRYPAFGNYISRLRSFAHKSWPQPKRSPDSFSAAGFFYTGKILCVSTAKLNIYVVVPSTLHSPLSFISLQGTLMKPAVSIAVEGLGDGWGTMMNPWQEHIKLFPNCVYVRYVM